MQALERKSRFGDAPEDWELAFHAETRRREKEKTIVRPYADALLEHIPYWITPEHDKMFQALKEVGYCDIFEYLSISYNQSLLEKRRAVDALSYEEQRSIEQRIAEDLPKESTLGMKLGGYGVDTGAYPPIRVHRIVRSEGFLTRIALMFGSKFKASLVYKEIDSKEGQWGWTLNLVTIRVTYKGDSISSGDVAQILKVLKEDKTRVPYSFANDHNLIGDCLYKKAPVPMKSGLVRALRLG